MTVQRESVPASPPGAPPAVPRARPGSLPSVFVQVLTPPGPLFIGSVVPLTAALSDLQPKRVKALLEGGADPNVREEDATSWPPLAFAIRGSSGFEPSEAEYMARLEMVDILLAHKADPNIRWCNDEDQPPCNERNGITPLMWAAILGDEEFTDRLLRHGADSSLRDWRGLTAADYWGVKPPKRPSSWCLAPRLKEPRGPYSPSPILEDAHLLVDPKYLEQADVEIREALSVTTDRSVETVKDQRVCEAAAVAYARRRPVDGLWRTDPRPVVPVMVVRAGPLWLVDDQADGGGRGIFDRLWRLLAWFEPPD